ncbi:MAG: single-stranded-DNA-specific exonuclease RecJ [Paludibacteraceae bacterium]|nr:single-stranded-DNA-specific exonuclease RecJ [Paludibacteraceae bacterium]
MEINWRIKELTAEEQEAAERLTNELDISPVAARILAGRGIRTAAQARSYIRPSLESLHDPFLMRDMGAAVDRLCRAIDNHERIMVYGDYDVDGTTAVALMYSFLKTQTDNLIYYIPDRYTEGYGISTKGIDTAKEKGCTLVIALDCGIKAVDKMEYANQIGVDFIICDHHTPGDETPKAVAVLNMKRKDCLYPFKELSGCGVGFKLVQAYAQRRGIDPQEIYRLLPLLAMSIASDIVPVTGENRILAFYGLRAINAMPSVGLQAIMQVAGIEGKPVTMNDLVYKFGPRINAAGRIKSGAEAVRLLITDDADAALQFAKDIDSYNQDRRDYDSKTTDEALEQLQKDPMNAAKHTTVVYSPDWHKGVVGIAASRLTETYYRPTIVLTSGEDDIISGSARSVSDFDIYTAIDSCRDLLTNFGGHKFAAGLSMHLKDLPEFQRRFEEYVAAHITPEQQRPALDVEAEVELSDMDWKMYKILQCLEPFGPGNERPLFLCRNLINNRNTRAVSDGRHLHLDLTDRMVAMDGIAFGQGDKAEHLQNGKSIDICFYLEENSYRGRSTLQMNAQDIKLNS